MVKEKRVERRRTRASPTTTRPAPATCRPTAWSPRSTRRCARAPTARATSTTASARTARSTTCRCAGASRTAATASTTSLAMRLFSFVLEHRRSRAIGPVAAGYRRAFWSRGEVFEMRLPTRGFYRELDPPHPGRRPRGPDQGDAARNRSPATSRSPASRMRRDAPRRRRTRPRDRAGGRRAVTQAMTRRRRCWSPPWRWRRSAARSRGGGRRRAHASGARAGRRGGGRARRPRPWPPRLYDDLEPAASDDRADAGTVTIKLVADARAPGARVLGAQGSRRRAAGDRRARAAARRWI